MRYVFANTTLPVVGSVGPSASAVAHDQRNHTGDERDGGHQDGAQPVAVSDHDGVGAGQASAPKRAHVIHLKNRVFLHDPEEHQDPERTEEVE